MLIKCPRCGFQQPDDTFCAQCGVDMVTYKPTAVPVWKKALSNPLIQLSILVLISGTFGLTLFEQGQKQFEKHPETLPPPMQEQTAAPPPSDALANVTTETTEAIHESAQEAAPVENALHDDSMTKSSLEAASTATTSTGPTPASATVEEKSKEVKAAGAKVQTPRVVVYYAEVDQDFLSNIANTSRNVGQFMEFGDYSAGLIPIVSKTLADPQVKILHKEIRTLDGAKSLQWFHGVKDSKDSTFEVGLTTFLSVSELENDNLRGSIEIHRSWREPGSSGGFDVQKKSFPAEFEVDSESGFFISGVMPRRSHLDNDQDLINATDIYKILASPQFKSGESNFMIFIDFEKGN